LIADDAGLVLLSEAVKALELVLAPPILAPPPKIFSEELPRVPRLGFEGLAVVAVEDVADVVAVVGVATVVAGVAGVSSFLLFFLLDSSTMSSSEASRGLFSDPSGMAASLPAWAVSGLASSLLFEVFEAVSFPLSLVSFSDLGSASGLTTTSFLASITAFSSLASVVNAVVRVVEAWGWGAAEFDDVLVFSSMTGLVYVDAAAAGYTSTYAGQKTCQPINVGRPSFAMSALADNVNIVQFKS
jgi:hypothetical protein